MDDTSGNRSQRSQSQNFMFSVFHFIEDLLWVCMYIIRQRGWFYNVFWRINRNWQNIELLWTEWTVTRFAMYRNHALHDFAPQFSGFLWTFSQKTPRGALPVNSYWLLLISWPVTCFTKKDILVAFDNLFRYGWYFAILLALPNLLLFSGLKSSSGGTHLDNMYYSLAGATLQQTNR